MTSLNTMSLAVFADKYGAKYEKAVACLTKDREALLAFFDFPAEHWDHLRKCRSGTASRHKDNGRQAAPGRRHKGFDVASLLCAPAI